MMQQLPPKRLSPHPQATAGCGLQAIMQMCFITLRVHLDGVE
jgi:hypothetical protein